MRYSVNCTFGMDDEWYLCYSICDESKELCLSFDSVDRNEIDPTNEEQEQAVYKNFVEENMDRILRKPRLADYGKVMRYVYEGVLHSESGLYKIRTDDWAELVEMGDFAEQSLGEVKQIVEKLNLSDVIWFDESGVVIAARTALLDRFNAVGCDVVV